MSSPAPAAREREAESPLAAGEPTQGFVAEEGGNTGAEVAEVAEVAAAAAAAAVDPSTIGLVAGSAAPDEDEEEDDDAANESDSSREEGETDESPEGSETDAAPPLPDEPSPAPISALHDGPPLPNEAVPAAHDDGWDCQWDANTQAWFFYNRFTGQTQWENPRVPVAATHGGAAAAAGGPSSGGGVVGVPQPPEDEKPAAGGYNPAIHGDYDPNAWYAQGDRREDDEEAGYTAAAAAGASLIDSAAAYAATAGFNRFHGAFQAGDAGPERHSDEAKARRQMNTYFDVDAAANAHGGRSLKAERSNKKPTKSELKAFKEKRRARKEEKRRAWLRD